MVGEEEMNTAEPISNAGENNFSLRVNLRAIVDKHYTVSIGKGFSVV